MDREKVSKRGGVRPGAGRPKGSKKMTPSDARPQHQLRANPDEWKLIQAFARMVKHGQRDICEEFLKSNDRL
mgnify:FL=1